MVFPDRFDELLADAGALGAERVQTFAAVPAVVAAAPDQIDFLVEVLPDVRRPQLTCLAVKRHPPDVAQTIRPNLGSGVGTANERIIWRDGVVLARVFAIHVDAMDFTEQAGQFLSVVKRI